MIVTHTLVTHLFAELQLIQIVVFSHDIENDEHNCYTLRVKEEGEVGVGMVVWSKNFYSSKPVNN